MVNAVPTGVKKREGVNSIDNFILNTSTDITLQYDVLNRLTNMVDASGTNQYTYTAGGQLWTEDGPWASDTVTTAITIGYGQG